MTEDRNISIVLVVHDQATLLLQNLPQFLSIAQEAHAEVIVVDDMSSDDTPDILKQFRDEHQELYTTFLPHSVVMNPSRLRLALAVGVKAAKGQCIVLADIRRPPISLEWLTGLDDGEAAVVFTSRKGNEVTHVVASEVEDLVPMILKTERKGSHVHEAQWNKKQRGAYDAVSVRRNRVFDVIKLFDQTVDGWQLLSLSLKI